MRLDLMKISFIPVRRALDLPSTSPIIVERRMAKAATRNIYLA